MKKEKNSLEGLEVRISWIHSLKEGPKKARIKVTSAEPRFGGAVLELELLEGVWPSARTLAELIYGETTEEYRRIIDSTHCILRVFTGRS